MLAALYYGAAKLGISLEVAEGVVTPVWAPTGLSLAALLLFGYRMWPGVALGALLANGTSDIPAVAAVGIAVGNTLEALTGAWLLRRFADFRVSLGRARDVIALVLLGALVSTAVSATVGSTTLLVADEIVGRDYRSTWFLWWFGDAIGAVIVTPLILTWATRRPSLRQWSRGQLAEALVLLGALVGISLVVFSAESWRYPYLIFPLLVWAALRFGVQGSATASFVVTAIAVWETVRGSVVVEGATPTESVQLLQALVAVVAVAMLIVAATIGEREEAEEALTTSLSVLQGTLDSTADGLLVVDLTGRIVSFNQRFVDMWQIPAEVVATRDDQMAVRFVLDQLAEPEMFEAKIRELYAHPDAESQDVLVFRDGRVFERYSRPQRVRGETVGRVWSFRDVTEARRSELMKGRFIDMASHEMRGPLLTISGFADVLLEDWDAIEDETKRDYLRRMKHRTDRLGRLVDALLLTSRLEAGQVDPQLAPIDVVDAVHRAVEDLGPTTSPIAVEAAEPVFVTADADHVQHILMNYLTNATKYGRPPVGVSVGRADGRAEVRVGDAGAGIPAELRADLFERFSPVRRALNPLAPGTGLGLWIVRGLARAQGGDAWYEHTASGPEFCVWLPLADGPPA